MKTLITILAIACTLIVSCTKKEDAPTPSGPSAPITRTLYVTAKSNTVAGCTLTVVSSMAFSGSSVSDSGYVRQSIEPQGQTASVVAITPVGSTVKVYVKSLSNVIYFSSTLDGVKTNNNVVKQNGLAYENAL